MIVLFIDSLQPGGAQRQLCYLANGLEKRDLPVTLMVYHDLPFFRNMLSAGVNYRQIPTHPKWQRAIRVCNEVNALKPTAVISFLEASCIYMEIAKIFTTFDFPLIVCERNLDTRFGHVFWLKTVLHKLSTRIVCNTIAQRNLLHSKAPWLRKKLFTIPNGIDGEDISHKTDYTFKNPIRFCTVARYAKQKNASALLQAMARLRKQHSLEIHLDWYGNYEDDPKSISHKTRLEWITLAKDLELTECVRFLNVDPEITRNLYMYDGLILPSLHEGCPNVLLEAMAAKVPVLASSVADNVRLLQQGACGLLFDPCKPEELAKALVAFATKSMEDRIEMVNRAHAHICSEYSIEKMVSEYLKLTGT